MSTVKDSSCYKQTANTIREPEQREVSRNHVVLDRLVSVLSWEVSTDRKVEVGVREGFVAQGEVPPLVGIVLKVTLGAHQIHEQSAVLGRGGSEERCVRVCPLRETVKASTKVQAVVVEALLVGKEARDQRHPDRVLLTGRRWEGHHSEIDRGSSTVT